MSRNDHLKQDLAETKDEVHQIIIHVRTRLGGADTAVGASGVPFATFGCLKLNRRIARAFCHNVQEVEWNSILRGEESEVEWQMARLRGVALNWKHRSVILPKSLQPCCRLSSTSQSSPPDAHAGTINPRWLSDAKQRIGKCITFGLKPDQVQEAGRIMQEIARDWRELLAGSEGFLTGPHRRGLFRHRVVWGDSDSMGHTNNVLYNRYAESGRVEWAHNYGRFIDPENAEAWMGLLRPTETGLILRKIITEFKFPMKYPDRISVYHKLGVEPTPDTDAFHFDVLILSEAHQRIAARLVEDCVVYDYMKSKKSTLKPFMIEVLRETWRLQQEAKRINIERLQSLLDRVRRLETESWDREGAIEDMGSQRKKL